MAPAAGGRPYPRRLGLGTEEEVASEWPKSQRREPSLSRWLPPLLPSQTSLGV